MAAGRPNASQIQQGLPWARSHATALRRAFPFALRTFPKVDAPKRREPLAWPRTPAPNFPVQTAQFIYITQEPAHGRSSPLISAHGRSYMLITNIHVDILIDINHGVASEQAIYLAATPSLQIITSYLRG